MNNCKNRLKFAYYGITLWDFKSLQNVPKTLQVLKAFLKEVQISKYRFFYDLKSWFPVIFFSNYRHCLVWKIPFPDHCFPKISKYLTKNLHFPSTSKYYAPHLCLHLSWKWLLMQFILSVVLERPVRFVTTVDVVLEEYKNCLPNNTWLGAKHVLIVFGQACVKGALSMISSTSNKTVCSSSKWLQKKKEVSAKNREAYSRPPKSTSENGLKVKQLVKQPPTLKTLMQKMFGLWLKNFTFSILSSLKLSSPQLLLAQLNCVQ